MIDLEDWHEEHAEALAALNSFCRRCERGIPPDRWATSVRQQELMVKGTRYLQQHVSILADCLKALADANTPD